MNKTTEIKSRAVEILENNMFIYRQFRKMFEVTYRTKTEFNLNIRLCYNYINR